MGEKRNIYRTLRGEPKGEIPLRVYRHKWEININPYSANVEKRVSS